MHLFSRLFKRQQNISSQPIKIPTTTKEAIIADRRYRSDTSYLLPKDSLELNRLDFQHYALRETLGADYEAPINKNTIKTILDVGCGTGRWAIERAKESPRAKVYGLDIEVPIPTESFPLNCHFYGGDLIKNGLPFADNSFDYVHQRLLVGAIPALKWTEVLQELARVTRPGGWVELLESGDQYHNMGPAQQRLMQAWNAGIAQAGFDLSLIPKLDTMLAQVGFKNITMRTIPMPLYRDAGRAGELMQIDIYNVCKSFKGFYVSRLGIPEDEFDMALAALPEEWDQNHTSYDFYLLYGQK